MLTLVIGGSGSGKSACAESLLLRSAASRRVYLATMMPYGAEAAERVRRHRSMRENKGFLTVERYTDLEHLTLPPDCAVLLEDLGNLCANELFSPAGGGADAVLRGVTHLARVCRELIVVSNEVFLEGSDYAPDTLRYLSVLAKTHRTLAAEADSLCEICCGIPYYHKGEQA